MVLKQNISEYVQFSPGSVPTEWPNGKLRQHSEANACHYFDQEEITALAHLMVSVLHIFQMTVMRLKMVTATVVALVLVMTIAFMVSSNWSADQTCTVHSREERPKPRCIRLAALYIT